MTDTGFYRDLEPHEILEPGDEYLTYDGSRWLKIVTSIGRRRDFLADPVRRPITPTPSVSEPEYRMLEVGERLVVGDEFYSGTEGMWMQTMNAGSFAGTPNYFRRPVTPLTMVEPDPSVQNYVVPDASLNPLDPKKAAGEAKAPLFLLPVSIMEETSWVLKSGAAKYGAFNWRENKVCASTYISAIMRHLNKWREREDLDTESGRSHLAHIAANCAILMDAAQHGTLEDDRA